MEITSIHIRYICPVCIASRTVICEPHKLAKNILMPVDGTVCATPKCMGRLEPFLYMIDNTVYAPPAASIERFNAFRAALQEAALYNASTSLNVSFSLDSVAKAENALSKIRERIQNYETAKTALIRFFNEFLP